MSIFDKYKYFALCYTYDAAGVDYLYLDKSLRFSSALMAYATTRPSCDKDRDLSI